MTFRVSTNYLHNSLLREMNNSNIQINQSSYQISTGNKAQFLSEMSEDASQLLSLEEVHESANTYVNNLKTVNARLDATEGALGSLEDLMVEAAQLWTLARTENSSETRATMAPKAEGLLNNFYSVFNTEFDGRYIFSGQNGSVAPLSGTPTATTIPADPPPTTYYLGDAALSQVVTGPATTDTYGVAGSDTAFSRMKAGLEALWYGLQNDSDTDIDGAVDMLEQARQDLSNVQGEIGGQIANFNLQIEQHESNQEFIQTRIDDISKVDITEAMTNFSQEQASLQASMLVMTQLNRLSLLDFI